MNKKIILITISSIIVLAIISGISYSIWMLTATQTDESVILSGCFNIEFTEQTAEIILENSYPMADSNGMKLDPFKFSIENTCDIDANYKINLEVSDTTTLSHSLIKGTIDDNEPKIMTSLEISNSTLENTTAYTLDTNFLPSNGKIEHDFRMWFDESGTLDNSQNKTIIAKIVISAEPSDKAYDYYLEEPVLDSKMIPINIREDGTITIADTNTSWYDYQNKKWANSVIVDSSFTTTTPGTVIPMESIEQMYVWIPRYQYNGYSIKSSNNAVNIEFVNTLSEAHPAFTFGGIELPGLWIGKFEQGENNKIIPNINSIHSMNVSNLYDNVNNSKITYSLDSATDIHMMKNTEWGAIAYISQSVYGICNVDGTCPNKVENNNYYNETSLDIVTGCGGEDITQKVTTTGINICPTTNRWNTTDGKKASTNGNITGIYDMAGGRSEYVMANMQNSSSNFFTNNSGFTIAPPTKYYDTYTYGTSWNDYARGLPGDATIELNPTIAVMNNWNSDYALFLDSEFSWFVRGGRASEGEVAGIWYFNDDFGGSPSYYTTRSIISITK